jgi:hypothetical protein
MRVLLSDSSGLTARQTAALSTGTDVLVPTQEQVAVLSAASYSISPTGWRQLQGDRAHDGNSQLDGGASDDNST